MADSEFLLTIGGTDVADDVWNWNTVTLTDAWTQRGTLTFTMRQAFGSEVTVDPYADVVFANRLTGQTLFRGFVAPAPIVQRWTDPTWVETDVSAVAYDAILDLVVNGAPLRIVKLPVVGGDWTMGAARSRIELALRSGIGDARLPARIDEPGTESKFSPYGVVTASGDVWEWDAGTTLAAIVSEMLLYVLALTANYRRVLKWFPSRGLVLADPADAILGSAPVDLTDAEGGRPAAIAKTTDASALVSGVVLNDNGDYTGTDQAPAGVEPRLTDVASPPDFVTSVTETNGWQIVRNTIAIGALSADIATSLGEPVGSYWPQSIYSAAFAYAQQGVDPVTAPVRYDVTSGLTPHDLAVGQELTFTWVPGTDVTATIQSVQTTFTDGVYDTKATGWPNYLDDGWTLSSGKYLDAAISASKPRRMRVHTLTVAGTPKTFLGSYATRTGR